MTCYASYTYSPLLCLHVVTQQFVGLLAEAQLDMVTRVQPAIRVLDEQVVCHLGTVRAEGQAWVRAGVGARGIGSVVRGSGRGRVSGQG